MGNGQWFLQQKKMEMLKLKKKQKIKNQDVMLKLASFQKLYEKFANEAKCHAIIPLFQRLYVKIAKSNVKVAKDQNVL